MAASAAKNLNRKVINKIWLFCNRASVISSQQKAGGGRSGK